MANKEKITIKLNNLKFDAQNPRLPMRLQGVTDENKVIDYMVKYGNVTELMLSIGETGYSEAEPLLVVKEGNVYFPNYLLKQYTDHLQCQMGNTLDVLIFYIL